MLISGFFVRLKKLWPYFGRQQGLGLSCVVLATVIGAATEPLMPALLQPLFDKGFSLGKLPLWWVPAALLSLFLVRGTALFVAQYALAYVSNRAMARLRADLFQRLLQAHPSLFQQQSASSLSNTVVYEVQNGSGLLVNALLSLLRDSLTLLALLAYLFYLNWQLSLIVLSIFPVVAWLMKRLTQRFHQLVRVSQSATDALAYAVEENVLAHRVVRLYQAEAMQEKRFDSLSQQLRRLAMKSTIANSAMTPLTQLVAVLALSVVVSMALWQNYQGAGAGHGGVTVGSFAAYVTAMLMLIAPLKHLSEVAGPLTRGLAALERGIEMLLQYPIEKEGSYQLPIGNQSEQPAIVFKNVGVRYGKESSTDADLSTPWALRHIHLSITAGQTVALVGSSGSGKTTLVNLLARFVDPTEGEVLVNGQAIQSWNLSHLRQQLAYVGQDVVMFNDSLLANITLGLPVDLKRVDQAVEAAYLTDFVKHLPQGLATPVGHNATELSGGQRQRLAIARALYKNAPILILDEATSALDSASEHAVQTALHTLMAGRTTLIVAHRFSSIVHAGHIVVFSQGAIVEQGSHTQLMAANGQYAQLFNLQHQKSRGEKPF